MTKYADDPDVYVDCQVDNTAGLNDWADPKVLTADGTELPATWLGAAGATRTLRVPLFGLEPGYYSLRLVVPAGNDAALGAVRIY